MTLLRFSLGFLLVFMALFLIALVLIQRGRGGGLAGAFGLTRLMETLLYEVSATDPVTFIAAPVLLIAISLLATWLPARRASRVNPVEALRAE